MSGSAFNCFSIFPQPYRRVSEAKKKSLLLSPPSVAESSLSSSSFSSLSLDYMTAVSEGGASRKDGVGLGSLKSRKAYECLTILVPADDVREAEFCRYIRTPQEIEGETWGYFVDVADQ